MVSTKPAPSLSWFLFHETCRIAQTCVGKSRPGSSWLQLECTLDYYHENLGAPKEINTLQMPVIVLFIILQMSQPFSLPRHAKRNRPVRCTQSVIGVSLFVPPWIIFDILPISTITPELFLLYSMVCSHYDGVFIAAGATFSLWMSKKTPWGRPRRTGLLSSFVVLLWKGELLIFSATSIRHPGLTCPGMALHTGY